MTPESIDLREGGSSGTTIAQRGRAIRADLGAFLLERHLLQMQ